MTETITNYSKIQIEKTLSNTISNLEKEIALAKSLKDSISEESGIEEKRKTINLLRMMENNVISTKELAIYYRDLEDDTEECRPSAQKFNASLTYFSEKAIAFSLPAMKSFRKTKDELSGLGKLLAAEVENLITQLKKSGKTFSAEKPVVQFTHYLSEDNAHKGCIPDADNLDCSHILDKLVAQNIIAEDNVLGVTLIHKGKISQIEKTLIYVYDEGFESDFIPEKKGSNLTFWA